MFERFTAAVTQSFDRANAAAASLVTPTVRLGVTGLARSGKTVFITSLIHNLLHAGRLPFFDAAAQGRLIGAYLEPQPDDTVPRFDYEANLEALTGPNPAWPDSTRQISQVRVTIEFEPIGALWRAFGPNRMHLDIVDYPGEWLLDLPLLNLTFEAWSQQAFGLAGEPFRRDAASEWLAFASEVPANAVQDEAVARRGAAIFTQYLQRCRQDALSLSSLTPGRFLMPGDLAGSPAVTFFPLRRVSSSAAPPRDGLRAMMERRFEAYKTHVVKPFFRDHFSRLDRQIVLADVLTVLNAGPQAVSDLQRALGDILSCFKHGDNGWLSLVLGKKIDRIVFAATKADHLHHSNHDRLDAILRLISSRSIERTQFAGASVGCFAVASVRATREVNVRQNGGTLPCIAGIPLAGEAVDGQIFDGKQELAIFPGDLPETPQIALSEAWMGPGQNPLHFVRFRPPTPQPPAFGKPRALNHIRLDRALNFLLADKLS